MKDRGRAVAAYGRTTPTVRRLFGRVGRQRRGGHAGTWHVGAGFAATAHSGEGGWAALARM
ncbi:hypothetical protein Srubr_80070 [Streptomyces rubradiris]|uniref:Uncharacterized protein n=1 Tax=Streptomyces rubradiris TaxID=285531 RepID=A0ABQ3RQL1_STRRR|nr:hypothetical protein GCM10018792_77620 [Streptomyces rubradiris]GHI58161.1 hypothetical protein Srubr_80070 [Streptomyces rubradiris]